MSAWSDLAADVSRYRDPQRSKDYYFLFEQGVWALVAYRFGRWAIGVKVPFVRRLLRALAFIGFKASEIVTGISLPPKAQIGRGFYVGHFGYVLINAEAAIGERCSVGPGVMIAARGGGAPGAPVLGDDVYVGSGAKILGGVRVGSGARIGANSVVIHDVPAGATAVGVPARVVRSRGLESSDETPPLPEVPR